MRSLLDELGGRDAMEVVVVGLCERVVTDRHLAPYFRDVARPRYEARLVDYLCALLADRPAAWQGRHLGAVHAELSIGDAEFDRFVALLEATLAAAGVSAPLVARVHRRIDAVRAEIVTAGVRR